MSKFLQLNGTGIFPYNSNFHYLCRSAFFSSSINPKYNLLFFMLPLDRKLENASKTHSTKFKVEPKLQFCSH